MSISVNVKWGKEAFEISFVPANGVATLKSQLSEKTNVPLDRMKLMPKSKGLWKGLLKDDFDLTSIDYTKIKAPIQILLMGSAAKLTGPKVKTVFLEDLPEEEVAKVAEPSGLNNLGNTCYLNSIVQCMRAIPVLKSGLSQAAMANASSGAGAGSQSQTHSMLLKSLSDLYLNLDRTSKPVSPTSFVMTTKMVFPQFAQTGPNGAPMQQDAEEFYSSLLNIISQAMGGSSGGTNRKELIKNAFRANGAEVKDEELAGVENLVDALFGIEMEETYTCDELDGADEKMDVDGAEDNKDAEPAVVRHDLHRKLVCNIQGGSDASSQTNVTHIMEGIQLSLNGKVEKHSDVLGRDAIWTRSQRISRLPPVLAVQFGRFFWKETPDSQDHTGVKCKVMKPVAFNGTLDIYDFCSEKIQKVLKAARDKALAAEEDEIAKKLTGAAGGTKEGEKEETSEKMEVEAEEEDEDMKAALAMSMAADEDTKDENVIIGPGLPEEFQGKYELFAVVTHKGRDADGGHYMGWVKANNQSNSQKIADTDEDNDDWFVFDDDEVSPCDTESVLKLKGGGDWHMSYINFYRAKK